MPCPSQGDLPDPGIKPIAGGFFAAEPSGKPVCLTSLLKKTVFLNCADVHLIGERLGNVK